jgi:hypothetical protein
VLRRQRAELYRALNTKQIGLNVPLFIKTFQLIKTYQDTLLYTFLVCRQFWRSLGRRRIRLERCHLFSFLLCSTNAAREGASIFSARFVTARYKMRFHYRI